LGLFLPNWCRVFVLVRDFRVALSLLRSQSVPPRKRDRIRFCLTAVVRVKYRRLNLLHAQRM
jgi:hypothetical protein